MPQIERHEEKRPYLLVIGLVIAAGLAAVFLVVWYGVIPGGESVTDTILRAQIVAKIENKATGGVKVLEDRIVHTWLPRDRTRLKLAEGKIYLDNSEYSAAAKAFESARQGGADALLVEDDLAQAYQGAGNTAKAREYYQKLVDYYSSSDRKAATGSEDRKKYYAGQLESLAR